MDNLPKNLTPTQATSLLAPRAQLRTLQKTLASLLQMALSQSTDPLRDQLVDRASELDSIPDVMRQALEAME